MNHDNNNDTYDDDHDEDAHEDDDDDEESGPAWVLDDDHNEDDAFDDYFDAEYDQGDDAMSSNEHYFLPWPNQDERDGEQQQQQEEEEEQQQQSTLPLPRDHSYLAGASHPLVVRVDGNHPTNLTNSMSMSLSTSSSPPITELAILELQGVVLFPGSTIPVKLRDPALITYLGHQIEVCRTVPHRQPKVCLGIVTFQRRPRPATPLDSTSSSTPQQHRLLGRIGTIATIQYTQERTTESFPHSSSSTSSAAAAAVAPQPHVWGRYQELDELVFTAVGTGRFEVLGPAANGSGSSVFSIRELEDVPLVPPPIGRFFTTMPSPSTVSTTSSSATQDQQSPPVLAQKPLWKHDQMIWNLSHLTPIPYFVYQRNWPWRLKDELIQLLQENQGRSNLPRLSGSSSSTTSTTTASDTCTMDQSILSKSPTQFSYWLSGNMPFTQAERLELLQMPSTLERLRTLRQKIVTLMQQQMLCYVGCTRCQNPLAPVSEIFSFAGAEGATSNYVNDHGYIHQITTLRSVVDERHLYFQGPPSTSNSYFPGYSWTITYCRYCASLLGWKFQRVSRRGAATSTTTTTNENCPDTFFGFQSASVRTMQD